MGGGGGVISWRLGCTISTGTVTRDREKNGQLVTGVFLVTNPPTITAYASASVDLFPCCSNWAKFFTFIAVKLAILLNKSSLLKFNNFRVATHQEIKNSLTFHWTFIDEKQLVFTFALAFFAGYRGYFSLHFQPFQLFVERGRRKLEESIHNENHWPQLLRIRRRVSNWSFCLLYSILFLFFERKCISKSWRKLINWKTEFLDFSLTLTISKIFPDFSKIPWLFLTLKNFRFSLTFPWPWQPWILLWRKRRKIAAFH